MIYDDEKLIEFAYVYGLKTARRLRTVHVIRLLVHALILFLGYTNDKLISRQYFVFRILTKSTPPYHTMRNTDYSCRWVMYEFLIALIIPARFLL